jgi:hypothetical protein
VNYVPDKQREIRDPPLIDNVILEAFVASIRVDLDAGSVVVRVLLTRGMKGCYVYFEDAGTRDFFLSGVKAELATAADS